MSIIRELQKLRIEDFQEQSKWIGPIFDTYNNFSSQVISVLNKGLLFVDNMVGVERDFEFTFSSNAATLPLVTTWGLNFVPKSLHFSAATENDSPIIALGAWRTNDLNQIEITQLCKITSTPAVSSLVSGSKYKIRIRVYP